MRLSTPVFLLIVACTGVVNAQVPGNRERGRVRWTVTVDPVNGIEVDDLTGRVRIGLDPEHTHHLRPLLSQSTIQSELRLQVEQRDALVGFSDVEAKLLQQVASRGGNPAVAIDAVRKARVSAVEEVLTPAQLERLRQIGYRIEVSTVGLANALASGRLGERVGIYENQVERILRLGKAIDARHQQKVLQFREEAETKLLAILDPEQRRKLQDALGKYFFFDGLDILLLDRNANLNLPDLDPKNLDQASWLLFLPRVQGELSLTSPSRKIVLNALLADLDQRRLSSLPGRGATEKAPAKLLETLTVDEAARLTQLAYRLHVSSRGLSYTLVRGHLRETARLREDQVQEIQERAAQLEDDLNTQLLAAIGESENELLKELVPEQREVCRKLIGEPFVYTDTAAMQLGWHKILERQGKAVTKLPGR